MTVWVHASLGYDCSCRFITILVLAVFLEIKRDCERI